MNYILLVIVLILTVIAVNGCEGLIVGGDDGGYYRPINYPQYYYRPSYYRPFDDPFYHPFVPYDDHDRDGDGDRGEHGDKD